MKRAERSAPPTPLAVALPLAAPVYIAPYDLGLFLQILVGGIAAVAVLLIVYWPKLVRRFRGPAAEAGSEEDDSPTTP